MDPLERLQSQTAEFAGRVGSADRRVRPVEPPTQTASESDARAREASARARTRPEVSISAEARALFDRAREDNSAEIERQRSEEERVARAQEEKSAVEQQQEATRFIAVRVGPAPVEDLTRAALREDPAGLNDRARLRVVEQVLSQPEPRDEVAIQRAVAAEEGRPALPGLETRDAPEAGRAEVRSERVFELPTRRAAGAEPGATLRSLDVFGRGVPESPGLRRQQAAAEDAARPEPSSDELRRVSSVAGQTGGVTEARDARDTSAASETGVSERRASAVAAELSQAARVEAERADAIVTRFLGNIEPEDPGPEPRAREFVGARPTS